MIYGLQAKDFLAPEDYKLINITNKMIYGLPTYRINKKLVRLPESFKPKVAKTIWNLSRYSSGGRIKFKTNANSIYINATAKSVTQLYHMTSIMKNGMDIYVNNEYYGSCHPNKDKSIKKVFKFEKRYDFNEITFHLPLYGVIKINSISVPIDTKILPSNDLLKIKPIIYYGSSITQGGAASNPGLSYQAILSRRLNIDFINLGFSGRGLGQSELAEYISNLETSLIVLDYWANPSSELFEKTLPDFVDIIRKKHQVTPIILISPFYSIGLTDSQNKKRKIALNFVKKRKENGDKNIYYVDGRDMLSKKQSFGLVDGRHLNSLGFWFVANGLEEKIRKILPLDRSIHYPSNLIILK